MKKKGFTLIELMIVVAIIGILAAVAIPRFADLIRKSQEGATKGNLGALRSALTIYYGDNEGLWPTSIATLTEITDASGNAKYLDEVPMVKTGRREHTDTSSEIDTSTDGPMTDAAGWWFNTTNGKLKVNCTHTDTKGSGIHLW